MNNETEFLTDALKVALQTEKDGHAFYIGAAERTKSERGKSVFLFIVQDEMEHIRRITREYEAIAKTGKWEAPLQPTVENRGPVELPSIFPKSETEVEKKVSPEADDLEALRVAMKLEDDGLNYYNETAAKTTDAAGKSFFQWLAGEEKGHRKIFQDFYDYLENPSYWFQLREKPIIEG